MKGYKVYAVLMEPKILIRTINKVTMILVLASNTVNVSH